MLSFWPAKDCCRRRPCRRPINNAVPPHPQNLGLPNEAELLALNPGIADPDSVLAGKLPKRGTSGGAAPDLCLRQLPMRCVRCMQPELHVKAAYQPAPV